MVRFFYDLVGVGLFQFQQLSAWSRTLCGPNAISGMKQANSPNGPWLSKTDHFSVSSCGVPGAD
jgi:hypothetical protein